MICEKQTEIGVNIYISYSFAIILSFLSLSLTASPYAALDRRQERRFLRPAPCTDFCAFVNLFIHLFVLLPLR